MSELIFGAPIMLACFTFYWALLQLRHVKRQKAELELREDELTEKRHCLERRAFEIADREAQVADRERALGWTTPYRGPAKQLPSRPTVKMISPRRRPGWGGGEKFS